VLVLSAALAGCGGSGAPQATGPSFEVTAAWVSGVGRVLVDGQGYTLYMFVPDAHGSGHGDRPGARQPGRLLVRARPRRAADPALNPALPGRR
jgi:predicted lipoprotein with Yx(FWY)xxD motif